MSAKSHTVMVGDIEVHSLEEGRGQPLLLLHAGTATVDAWGEAMLRLADRYRVFALDTRGHGKTTNPAQKLSYAQFADDVAGFIAALGLKKPLIVGYSDGGQTALEFGLRHPGKAGALVMGGTLSEPSEVYMEGLHGWGFPVPGEVDFERLAREFGPYFEQIKLAHTHHYGSGYWQPATAVGLLPAGVGRGDLPAGVGYDGGGGVCFGQERDGRGGERRDGDEGGDRGGLGDPSAKHD